MIVFPGLPPQSTVPLHVPTNLSRVEPSHAVGQEQFPCTQAPPFWQEISLQGSLLQLNKLRVAKAAPKEKWSIAFFCRLIIVRGLGVAPIIP